MAARSNSPDVSTGAGSTSTISAATVTGWHMLKIQGYSQTNSVKSGTFTVEAIAGASNTTLTATTKSTPIG
ncbi:hypothetical protein PR202_ga22519 [Eleusine coracana subsp. coracana]|uniref:Uncharacterized protein n=1 Tax=Eleusine coracana subsp. coracana TaxID=191504 RepID=A0AAV5D3V6_ELECO|nr:hypothetical protein PR202_ga22519 [Eleusine coracana subsp. coracana]